MVTNTKQFSKPKNQCIPHRASTDEMIVKKQVDKLVELFNKNDLVVFVGSAISMASPSHLLSGAMMRDSIIHASCKKHASLGKYEELIKEQHINPEMVYQIMLDSIGAEIFLVTHNICETNKFNSNHMFLAQAAKHGKISTILTTNFDHLIEDALESVGCQRNKDFIVYKDKEGFREYIGLTARHPEDKGIHIVKLHGTIENKESMIVTINQTGKGLTKEQAVILDALLKEKHFLFVGYSGNDKDIYQKLSNTKGRGIVWNVRRGSENHVVNRLIDKDRDRRQLLRLDLNDLFMKLGEILNLALDVPQNEETTDFVSILNGWVENMEAELIINIIGGILNYIGQTKNALLCFQESLLLAKTIDNEAGISNDLYLIGLAYSVLGDAKKALQHFRESLRISQEIGHQVIEAASLRNIGLVYHHRGAYKKAIEHLVESLRISKEICLQSETESSLNDMALIFTSQGEYDKAIECYRQALKIERKTGGQYAMAICFFNIGNVYNKRGDYPNALIYFKKSLTRYQIIELRYGEAYILNCIGSVYRSQGRYDKAIQCFEKSLKTYQDIGRKRGEIGSLNNISTIT